MREVVFIDTSVLLNVLNVPGNVDSPEVHRRDRDELSDLINGQAQLVLPLTTIIETGNAIAKVSSNHPYVQAFVGLLQRAIDGEAPWLVAGEGTHTELLSLMLTGGDVALADHMRSGVGTGDAAILAEAAQLRARIPSATPVRIWTHDQELSAYG